MWHYTSTYTAGATSSYTCMAIGIVYHITILQYTALDMHYASSYIYLLEHGAMLHSQLQVENIYMIIIMLIITYWCTF